jgi:hypothetical protein
MLPHNTTKEERRQYYANVRNSFAPHLTMSTERTMVAYGDASVRSTMPSYPPLPQKVKYPTYCDLTLY